MQEILLAGGKTGKYFPDSGPGTKVLYAGDKNYGYFGEVSEDELGLNPQLTNLLNNTYATTKSVGVVKNTWFKFILNGRVLFWPKIPLAAKIPLKDLYAMRAAADADSATKPAKDPTTGQPLYAQNLYLSQAGDTYKVRLFDLAPTTDVVANNSQFTLSSDAEVVKLLFAMITGSTAPDILKIKNRTAADFSYINGVQAGQCFAEDLSIGDANGNYQQSYYTLGYSPIYNYVVGAATEWGWRPVLEHIPGTEKIDLLLMPDGLDITNEGMPTQVTLTGTVIANLFALTGFTNEANTIAVAPSGNPGAMVLGLQSFGGYLITPDTNTSAPILGFNDDTATALYEMTSGTDVTYSGYMLATTDSSVVLTETYGGAGSDLNGYVSPA